MLELNYSKNTYSASSTSPVNEFSSGDFIEFTMGVESIGETISVLSFWIGFSAGFSMAAGSSASSSSLFTSSIQHFLTYGDR